MCMLRLTGVGVVRVRFTGANLGTGLTNIVGVLTAHPTDESIVAGCTGGAVLVALAAPVRPPVRRDPATCGSPGTSASEPRIEHSSPDHARCPTLGEPAPYVPISPVAYPRSTG
jgi:hypothetical protein